MRWAFGPEAMQTFTARYQARMPGLDFAALPTWDLVAALRPAFKLAEWAGDPVRERAMRAGLVWFVDEPLAALPRS